MTMRTWLKRRLQDHARNRGFGSMSLYRAGRAYANAYENIDYSSMETNGEFALLERLGAARLQVLFDVGANRGAWANKAHEVFPEACIVCFEPVSGTASRLRHTVANFATVEELALSDTNDETTIKVYPHSDLISTLSEAGHALWEGRGHSNMTRHERCRLQRGTDYCAHQDIERIDLLKIDTEGHELRVIEGFRPMIDEGRISLIQFEHNEQAVLERVFLRDLLERIGDCYVFGKIMPHGVEVLDYSTFMERFHPANYLCISKREPELLACALGSDR